MAKILIIDDEADLVEVCALVLESAGHTVERAVGSNYGIERALATSQALDLVIVDLVMPAKDGEEVVRELRESPRTRSVPIVVMSALADGRQRAERMSVDAFLRKPFVPDELVGVVARVLASTRSRYATRRHPEGTTESP